MFEFFKAELKSTSLLTFHNDVAAMSCISPAERNFWMCLCNDFENWKFIFATMVEDFLVWQKDHHKPIDRIEWLKFVGDQTLRQRRKI